MTALIERGSATAPVPPRPGETPSSRLRSSTGKKAVMAVTGVILVLYLVAHVVGNLKIFFGARAFNDYAHWLRHVGEPAVPGRTVLTIVEIVLTLSVIAHMWAAVSLARRAARARPVKYAAGRRSRASGYATRTMRYGGVIILLFVIWHVLDLTVAVVNPAGGAGLPYERMVEGFAPGRWPVTLFYVVALAMLGLHLRHGVWSAGQTLGLAARWSRHLRFTAGIVSAALVLGFLSVPIAITIGVIK